MMLNVDAALNLRDVQRKESLLLSMDLSDDDDQNTDILTCLDVMRFMQ